MKKNIKISGMTCVMCAKAVERATKKLDGVLEADVNFANEKLNIIFDENKITLDDIYNSIKKAGYDVVLEENEDKEENVSFKFFIVVSFAIIIMYISMGHMLGLKVPKFLDPHFNAKNFATIQLLLTIIVMLIFNKIYINGFKNIFKLNPNMDSLVAVGTIASFLYSFYSTLFIFRNINTYYYSMNLYYESVVVILVLINVGKYLEKKSKKKTTAAISKLIQLRPKTAILIEDNLEKEVKIEEIKVGDIVKALPGTVIATDGIVIEGESYIDESMITGESIAVHKKSGDKVVGATINKNGFLKYKVTETLENTTLSKIINFVEEAQKSKMPISNLADKVALYFVPIVFILAISSAFFWYFIANKDFSFSITIFISVLVIACPCSLGLAIPTSIMVATGKAAENGILIRNGEALEEMSKLDAIVFDKTGTLTNGEQKLVKIYNFSSFTFNELLKLVASVENLSNHPIAKSIVESAKEKNIDFYKVENFNYISGHGIEAKIFDYNLIVGNNKLLKNIDLKSEYLKITETISERGSTPIYVVIDNNIAGIFEIRDTIREDSKRLIEEIKKLNIEVFMITGDNKKTANFIAKQLNLPIENIYAEILPQEKAIKIKQLQEKYQKVIFVGDGINDAPALVQANVGIAIGSGSDIAIESADIILMSTNIFDILKAIKISKKTVRNIKENLFWAFIYNIVGLPVAMGVLYIFNGMLLNPMIAGLAMSLSSISVVFNALRLRKQ